MTSANTVTKNVLYDTLRRWLALGAAIGITLAGGALYGHYSQRWGISDKLASAGSTLEQFPRTIGNWEMVEEEEIDELTLQMLQCRSYVHRRYQEAGSGRSVQLVILVGPPGPIAVHTPEICYSSRNYDIKNDRVETTLDYPPNTQHTFWQLDFAARGLFAERLRVYYAWSRGETWSASRRPRFQYATAPFLYKIQIASQLPAFADAESHDAAKQFLNDLIRTDWTVSGAADASRS